MITTRRKKLLKLLGSFTLRDTLGGTLEEMAQADKLYHLLIKNNEEYERSKSESDSSAK